MFSAFFFCGSFLWLPGCLVVFCLIHIYMKNFLISCLYFWFNSTIVRDYIFYSLIFSWVLFSDPEYGLPWWMLNVNLKRYIFCCCWLGCSITASYIMVDKMIQVFCIFTGILFSTFLSSWKNCRNFQLWLWMYLFHF